MLRFTHLGPNGITQRVRLPTTCIKDMYPCVATLNARYRIAPAEFDRIMREWQAWQQSIAPPPCDMIGTPAGPIEAKQTSMSTRELRMFPAGNLFRSRP